MSATKSNLTLHNLDMVVAVTQAGINTAMGPFLRKMENEVFEYYKVKTEGSSPYKEVSSTELSTIFKNEIQAKVDKKAKRGKTYNLNQLEKDFFNERSTIMDSSIKINAIDKTGYKNEDEKMLGKFLNKSAFHLGIKGKLVL